MELYFLRHGIAADTGTDGSGDAGRPLTSAGIARMQAAARGMRALQVRPDVLLSSPLLRARETAALVAAALNLEPMIVDALAPGCDMARLLGLLEAHDSAQRVMLVGHEPDFSLLISALTGGSQIMLKKGGLALVDLELPYARPATLAWLVPPRLLRACGDRTEK